MKQPVELYAVQNGHKEKIEKKPGSQISTFTDDYTDEDHIPLALLAKRIKKDGVGHIPSRENDRKESVKKKDKRWQTKSLNPIAEKLKISKSPLPNITHKIKNDELAPIELFKFFFSEEFVQFICDETIKYAAFKGDHTFFVSTGEMYVYFGILILSGYNKLPSRRMYWERKSDTYNHLVSNSISRDRFELIHRYLHFNDNNKIDPNNKLYKIQPLIDRINEISQALAIPLGENFSLDEAMEPYYGHHHMKQFIRGKPIRYGFKFWCLSTSEGYLLKFEKRRQVIGIVGNRKFMPSVLTSR